MDSWRDRAPAALQADLDALFGAAIDAAEHFLGVRGEFFPTGFSTAADGQPDAFSADPGLGEQPPSLEVLAALLEGARTTRDTVRAVALVFDVTLADGGDAVCVQLEHRDGVTLQIHVPYRRRRFRRGVSFGEMGVSYADPQVWAR